MTSVVGRVWGWVRPVVTYRPWGSSSVVSERDTRDKHVTDKEQTRVSWGLGGLKAWVWGESRKQIDQTPLVEEYWEAEEKLHPMDIEDLGAGKPETEPKAKDAPRWWNKILQTPYVLWPRGTGTTGLKQRKCVGWDQGGWGSDHDGEFSDYETPPPSPIPAPSPQQSAFRLFTQSWKGEIVPEHYEICFNFIRHLFDLFVVGFLWTVSPPTKLIMEVLGVQGALKLWLHGMAMFLVSTVGMAGLLLLIQEYLPQFALVYGIVQALVISVSIRQSVILGEDEPPKEERTDDEGKTTGVHTETHRTTKEGLCHE